MTKTVNPYWAELEQPRAYKTWLGLPAFDEDAPLSSIASLLFPSSPAVSARVHRKEYCHKYSCAIPDPATLHFVAEWLSPRAVEMGAGTGYWAWQLSQLGIDMLCFDEAPPDQVFTNHYHSPRSGREQFTGDFSHLPAKIYHPIAQGTPEVLSNYPDRTLFLCWPPDASDMAVESLQAYSGRRLVYIGECEGGCNGDDAFFERLEQDWHEVASYEIVQWNGLHDYVTVYEREAAS